jgi:hypothetical protein
VAAAQVAMQAAIKALRWPLKPLCRASLPASTLSCTATQLGLTAPVPLMDAHTTGIWLTTCAVPATTHYQALYRHWALILQWQW